MAGESVGCAGKAPNHTNAVCLKYPTNPTYPTRITSNVGYVGYLIEHMSPAQISGLKAWKSNIIPHLPAVSCITHHMWDFCRISAKSVVRRPTLQPARPRPAPHERRAPLSHKRNKSLPP